MMKRVASLGDSRHHCHFIFFVMYTSKMKGTTMRPHQLSTHTRKSRYRMVATANLVHWQRGFNSFFSFVAMLFVGNVYVRVFLLIYIALTLRT